MVKNQSEEKKDELINMKQCYKCKQFREISFFHKNSNKCKKCKKHYDKRYREEHKKERMEKTVLNIGFIMKNGYKHYILLT